MTCFRLPSGKTVLQWCRENDISYQVVYGLMEKGLTPKKACMKAKRKGIKRSMRVKHYYNGAPLYKFLLGSGTKAYKDVMNAYNRGYSIEEAVKKFGVKQ